MGTKIIIPVSYGELLDKISILEIKAKKCINSEQLKNIYYELQLLQKTYTDNYLEGVDGFMGQLRVVNEQLWDLEDQIRVLAYNKNLGQEFVHIAIEIYKKNDERARIKQCINLTTKSTIFEEKIYSCTTSNCRD